MFNLTTAVLVPLDSYLSPAIYSDSSVVEILTLEECLTLQEQGIVYRERAGFRFALAVTRGDVARLTLAKSRGVSFYAACSEVPGL